MSPTKIFMLICYTVLIYGLGVIAGMYATSTGNHIGVALCAFGLFWGKFIAEGSDA